LVKGAAQLLTEPVRHWLAIQPTCDVC